MRKSILGADALGVDFLRSRWIIVQAVFAALQPGSVRLMRAADHVLHLRFIVEKFKSAVIFVDFRGLGSAGRNSEVAADDRK